MPAIDDRGVIFAPAGPARLPNQAAKLPHVLDPRVRSNYHSAAWTQVPIQIVEDGTAMQRTFVMLKPDTVQRGLIGEVIGRFERKGLKLRALKLLSVSEDQAMRHYAVHEGKPFYAGLISYIRSSPVVAMVLEGPEAVAQVRALVGATKPNEAAPGTIRGDLGVDISNNLVHAADSPENAEYEIGVYFTEAELVGFNRSSEGWISGKPE